MNTVERESLILDRAIDLMLAGGRPAADPLVDEAAAMLAAFTEIIPAPEARDAARTRMFAQHPRRVRRRVVWIAGVATAMMVLAGGVAAAARNALPGDPLYGVRRSMQTTRLVLTFGSTDRANQLLDRAAGDLAGARTLASGGRVRDALDALEAFRRDLIDARRAIASVGPADRATLQQRADTLEASADAFESALTSAENGSPTTSDRLRGGDDSGASELESHDSVSSDSTSGDAKTSGDDETISSPQPSPTSGDGSGGGSPDGDVRTSPSPSPTSSSGDGVSGSSGSDSGSGSATSSEG